MYQAIYKCRLCGKEFSDGETGERNAETATIALSVFDSIDLTTGFPWHNIHMRTICHCKDGSFGLADFQGFKKAED